MHEEVTHPCIQHKLALIRDVDAGHKKFRELATEITMFVCYEALKNIKVREGRHTVADSVGTRGLCWLVPR